MEAFFRACRNALAAFLRACRNALAAFLEGHMPRRVGRYSFRYSRSRFVWDRLTGISVAFASFILRM